MLKFEIFLYKLFGIVMLVGGILYTYFWKEGVAEDITGTTALLAFALLGWTLVILDKQTKWGLVFIFLTSVCHLLLIWQGSLIFALTVRLSFTTACGFILYRLRRWGKEYVDELENNPAKLEKLIKRVFVLGGTAGSIGWLFYNALQLYNRPEVSHFHMAATFGCLIWFLLWAKDFSPQRLTLPGIFLAFYVAYSQFVNIYPESWLTYISLAYWGLGLSGVLKNLLEANYANQ